MLAKILLVKLFLLIAFVHCEFYKECQNKEVGTFVARLKNCTQYLYCNDMDSLMGNCPPGHYFDPVQSLCDENDGVLCNILFGRAEQELTTATLPSNIQYNSTNNLKLTTTTTKTTTTASTTTSTTAHIITQELTDMLKPINALGRPSCHSTLEQTFAHPQRCEYYYKCTGGFLTILRCSFNYGWDHERELCVPFNEAKCANAVKHR